VLFADETGLTEVETVAVGVSVEVIEGNNVGLTVPE